MPEYALWTLVVSLILLSIGLSCKIAELLRRSQLTDEEINGFVKQITSLNQKHNKEISNHSELNDAVMNKILEEHNKELQILFAKIIELQKPEGFLTQLMKYKP